ncbi:MAG: hypothetical protein ABIJ42_01440, partial [Acidobacteriota bacterium]
VEYDCRVFINGRMSFQASVFTASLRNPVRNPGQYRPPRRNQVLKSNRLCRRGFQVPKSSKHCTLAIHLSTKAMNETVRKPY